MPRITLDGELYSHKNSRQIGRNFKTGKPTLRKSDAAIAQAEDYAWQLANFYVSKQWRVPEKSEYPIHLHFKIFRKTRGRFDYVNVVQGVLDAMVKAGYLPDDDADHVLPVFVPYEVDRENPRVEIWYGE